MKELMLEKWLTAWKQFGHIREVFVNPTRKEMFEVKDMFDSYRFIADAKYQDFYVFDVNSMHGTTWNKQIAKEINDNRKMYEDVTLFGGGVENRKVYNAGVMDSLYSESIRNEWIMNPDMFKFANKYADVTGWIKSHTRELSRG